MTICSRSISAGSTLIEAGRIVLILKHIANRSWQAARRSPRHVGRVTRRELVSRPFLAILTERVGVALCAQLIADLEVAFAEILFEHRIVRVSLDQLLRQTLGRPVLVERTGNAVHEFLGPSRRGRLEP